MASKTIKGITIQIDGQATGLGKVLKEIDQQSGKTTSSLKSVNAALKLDPTNTELIAQKQRMLGQEIDTTSTRLDALKQAQENAAKSVGNFDAWQKAYTPIQEQIVSTKERIKELKKQQEDMADANETSSDAYKDLGVQIERLNIDLKDLKSEAKAVSDEFGNPISPDEYDKLQREIVFTNDKLKKLTAELNDTEKGMDDLGDDTSRTAKDLDKFADAASDAEKESVNLGSVVSGVMKGFAGLGVVAGVKGLVEGMGNLEEASREYRTEQGKLTAAFTSSHHSAETARATYKSLQGIIGETDQSVEAAQQIALLATSEQEAGKWASYAAGLVGKFGDALQPETFYESANETLKLGEATGAFTQMLEGCGLNVEQFNKDLAACTTEQEKQALMLSITEQALGSAAESYRETNAETIRANEANEAMNESMAAIGSVIGPVITDMKLMGAEILGDLVPAIQFGVEVFGDGLDFVKSITDKVLSETEDITSARLDSMKKAYEENGGGLKGLAAATMDGVMGFFVDGYQIIDRLTDGKLSSIRDSITGKMAEAQQKVGEIISNIKGFFGFEFKWPKLKLPHFSVTPKGWEIGDLLKGSIPKLSIKWNKEGGIFPSAAIFGAYGGKLQGGGEALNRSEALLPIDSFYQELDSIMRKYSGGGSGVVVQVLIDSFVNNSDHDIDELTEMIADRFQTKVEQKGAAL